MWFWSNLPDTISAEQTADLYRRRWSIEGMFQRLESVLDSEIESLGSPRAVSLSFASTILAYNVLAVLKRSVEQAHGETQPESWEASTFHLAVQARSSYEGLQIALPSDYLSLKSTSETLVKLVAKSMRGQKIAKPKEWQKGKAANAHVSTDRVLKAHK